MSLWLTDHGSLDRSKNFDVLRISTAWMLDVAETKMRVIALLGFSPYVHVSFCILSDIWQFFRCEHDVKLEALGCQVRMRQNEEDEDSSAEDKHTV